MTQTDLSIWEKLRDWMAKAGKVHCLYSTYDEQAMRVARSGPRRFLCDSDPNFGGAALPSKRPQVRE